MNRPGAPCLRGGTYARASARFQKSAMLAFLLSMLTVVSVAQTVTWTDAFVEGQAPSTTQCQNWTNFLNQLGGKSFASVTISGTFDETGRTITDPAAATQLAQLLYSRTPGTVTSGNHYWTVGKCYQGACGSESITLSVDGNKTTCDCLDTYALKPHSQTPAWGGVNTPSCNAPSQTMKLVFHSGVSVIANGPTTLCPGDKVELRANPQVCAGPYTYKWSNDATTETITVSAAGDYAVTVTGADGCKATSSPVKVTLSEVSVDAGADVIFCDAPVQLNAVANRGGGSAEIVNSLCLYDFEGGTGNCTFVENLCTEGADFITNQIFSSAVTSTKPSRLEFLLYYSPFTEVSTFSFLLNGQVIGTFVDNNPTSTCEPAPFGQYPRKETFNSSDFEAFWKEGQENTLAVQVVGDGLGVYLAGITAQVVTSNESYVWSPALGLSDPTIKNPLASPDETTPYTVTYTNSNGCTSTDIVNVLVSCANPPLAVCKPLTVLVDANCEATVQASDFDAGSTSSSGGALQFSVSPAGPYPIGETAVTLTVTDSNGQSSTCITTVTVLDTTPPVILAPEELVVVNLDGACGATLPIPQVYDNCEIEIITNNFDGDILPVGKTLVTWTVTDIHGNAQTAVQSILVTNAEPVITAVNASPSPVETNKPVALGVVYADNNIKDATIDWGDLTAPEVIAAPLVSFNATHAYANPGTYNVTVTLTDLCGASVSYVYESITVFEKRVGSVEGSGWFYSKAGYYRKDRRAEGKAQFSFDAEYKSTGTVPVGSATFNFKAGKLNFRSTEYELLRIDGASAFLTGYGTVKGKAGYKILLAMVDEQSKANQSFETQGRGQSKKADRIRVKIWDPQGAVIYDTQAGAPEDAVASTSIDGGSITVNESESFQQAVEDLIDTYFGDEATSVYPNPFVDVIEVQFNATSQEMITMQLTDLAGKIIFAEVYPVREDSSYTLNLPEGVRAGIYILKIQQGARTEFFPMLHR